MTDVLIVGGGVVGLSIAYELAGQGVAVRLLEQGDIGREASWAGAGILPPGNPDVAEDPWSRLRAESHSLWPQLSRELLELTGIDNGFRQCGGLAVGFDDGQTNRQAEIDFWKSEGVKVEPLDTNQLVQLEPEINTEIAAAYYLPQQAQIRNPRHLKALIAGCAARGVQLVSGCPVVGFEQEADRIVAVQTVDKSYVADAVCVAAGAWSGRLLSAAGIRLNIEPVRGQIVLLRTQPVPIRRIIEEGPRYLVPRPDGRILVGSTEEHAGFHKTNTAGGVAGLLQLATRLVPCLAEASIERCWSGLRPHSADGLPYLDRIPETSNLYVAAGHFRSGLQTSPATARFMRSLILNQEPTIAPQAFSCTR